MTSCPSWCDNIWDSRFGMAAFSMKINALPDRACHLLYFCCQHERELIQQGRFSGTLSDTPFPSHFSALNSEELIFLCKQRSSRRGKDKSVSFCSANTLLIKAVSDAETVVNQEVLIIDRKEDPQGLTVLDLQDYLNLMCDDWWSWSLFIEALY